MTKHTFKVGDRVRFLPSIPKHWWFKAGEAGTVSFVSAASINVKVESREGDTAYVQPEHIELVVPKVSFTDDLGGPFSGAYRTTEINKTWIIAVLDNKGKPRPATKPQVYVSAAQAEKVAKEMAEKNAGETFMVLQGTAVAATPAVKSVELVRL